jgi:hypothetical protein
MKHPRNLSGHFVGGPGLHAVKTPAPPKPAASPKPVEKAKDA